MTSSPAIFVGRSVTPRPGEDLRLSADDLTTHGFIAGMTGSGKTALGIVMIEELLMRGIPVLAIDPKGDLANLLLAFPSLSPEEFAPWVPNAPGTTADGEATRWTKGLSSWGLGTSDVARLRASRDAVVYTPGSAAAEPLNLFGAAASPPKDGDDEDRRELMVSYLSGLLGLVGLEADPVKSKELVFLSRCMESLWDAGSPVTLEALLETASAPSFSRVGALSLETYYPVRERQELIFSLNNVLASPSTAAFQKGAPPDLDAWLRPGPGGRARLSVVAIAGLSDPERRFVVATLLSRITAWMRTQPGSPTLRSLVYIDEIFGFFPPSAEPPTKRPLLTLLKQARAFGLGVVLATQNPVDLDYKGLANCGTWFVGTLQTERDKERLAEGLTSASGTDAVGLLSQTRKRVFLLHDIHRDGPALFETRWAMSYLRGPMTREELTRAKALLLPSGGEAPKSDPGASPSPASPQASENERPMALPAGWTPKWVAKRGAEIAKPYLLVKYAVRYRKDKSFAPEATGVRLYPLDAASAAEVLEGDPIEIAEDQLLGEAPAGTRRYEDLPPWVGPAGVKAVDKAVRDRLSDKLTARLLKDPVNGMLSAPGETAEQFSARLQQSFAPSRQLVERLEKKRRELEAAEAQEKSRSFETIATSVAAAADFISGFLGKRKSLRVGKVGSVLTKRRMEGAAESRIEELRAEVLDLEAKTAAPDPAKFEELEIVPLRAHVDVLAIGVAWVS